MQALAVDKNGVLYAATNPDGKVYRIERAGRRRRQSGNGDGTIKLRRIFLLRIFRSREQNTSGTWLSITAGNLYVATGDHGEIYRVTPKGEHSVFFKSDEAHIRVLAVDAKRQSDRWLGRQRTGLPDQAQRRRLRTLQRPQERNHCAGHRQGGKYLCRRRGRKASRATPTTFRAADHHVRPLHPRPERHNPGRWSECESTAPRGLVSGIPLAWRWRQRRFGNLPDRA